MECPGAAIGGLRPQLFEEYHGFDVGVRCEGRCSPIL